MAVAKQGLAPERSRYLDIVMLCSRALKFKLYITRGGEEIKVTRTFNLRGCYLLKRSLMMVVFALLIINKAGGLVYNRTFSSGLTALSGNDYLVLAGTFHGVHAISRNLSPVNLPRNSTGIESLQTSRFLMSCYQTPTGTKFLLFTEPAQMNTDVTLKKLYELYADFVMKNPFYSLEMPIRSEKFERAVQGWIAVR